MIAGVLSKKEGNKMKKAISILFVSAMFLFAAASIVSAYEPTFQLSDSVLFKEDISGENRGFLLKRSIDMPRKTIHGYYDWSQYPDPAHVVYPHESSYKLSDNSINQAFRTFRQDSKDQTQLERDHLRYHHSYNRYGFAGRYSYGYRSYSYRPLYYRFGY